MPPIYSTFFLINLFLMTLRQLFSTTVPHFTYIFVCLDHFVTHLSPPPLSINYSHAGTHTFFLDTQIIIAGIRDTTVPPLKLPFPDILCLMNILFLFQNPNSPPPNDSIFNDDSPHPLTRFLPTTHITVTPNTNPSPTTPPTTPSMPPHPRP